MIRIDSGKVQRATSAQKTQSLVNERQGTEALRTLQSTDQIMTFKYLGANKQWKPERDASDQS